MTRVLLLDDDPLWREMLGRTLRDAGYETATTDVPATALEQAGEFDLVILDLAMPTMDGLTLLERIKATSPGVTVIVVTSYSYSPVVEEAELLGADAVLEKRSVEGIVEFADQVPVRR